jgi:hypothetical protein
MRRFSYQDWVKTAPGISPTSPSGSSVHASNLGQPDIFIDPRRAMLSVRLNLGR